MRLKKELCMVGILSLLLLWGAVEGWCDGEVQPALIIDTDMGLDDARALFALLACADLDIHALVTVEGSASLGMATDHALGLLEYCGYSDFLVVRGTTAEGPAPPSWREHANGLGGCPFAPPRTIPVNHDWAASLKAMLEDPDETFQYLALGPLGNLAGLEERFPGILEQLSTLWIPVHVQEEGELSAWNLSWDKASTKKVFRHAKRIVLLDVDSTGTRDAMDFLSRVEDHSPAGQWIHRHLVKSMGRKTHIMLFDELAAAALMDQELLRMEEKKFRFLDFEDSLLRIQEEAGGNLSMASFRDLQKTLNLLVHCWSMEMEEHLHQRHDLDPETFMKAFHGHLGPYVVLGYRMGKLALEKTGSQGHFDLSVEVHTLLVPPPSCLIDGLQLGCGCTMGKGNIQAHALPAGRPGYAHFKARNGKEISIHLKAEVTGMVKQWVDEKGVEAAGHHFLDLEEDALFEWRVEEK